MTEAEWVGKDATPLLAHVLARTSSRKARLLAIAHAGPPPEESGDRPMWCLALLVAGRYADGGATLGELRSASQAAYDEALAHDEPVLGEPSFDAVAAAGDDPAPALGNIHRMATEYYDLAIAREFHSETDPAYVRWVEAWHSNCARLIREIYVNPFRTIAVDRSWQVPEVLTLARAIYAERAFDRIPELVPALARAGCDDAALLDHCRDPGGHILGCWALDLILGKN